MDLPEQGFKETYRAPNLEELIYESEWCRMSFICGGWDQVGGNTMYIRYGRLHALVGQKTMLWQGEEYNCWHHIDHPLNFLDVKLPANVIQRFASHPVTDPFYKKEVRRQYHCRQPEWLAAMH